MAVFLGVDGGGSGCRAAIADAGGRVLGRGSAGPANVSTDMAGALENLRAAVTAAAAEAGVGGSDLAECPAHLGIAGVLRADQALAVAQGLGLPRARVTDDRTTQLRGALGKDDGALVALGTGTIIGVQRAGRVRFAGGWGLVLSDEASGGWLGLRALSLTLEARDGLSLASDLTTRLDQALHGPAGIVAFAARATPADFAAHAPDVIAAADTGDAVAVRLMREGAAYIARTLRALGHAAGEPLCLTGGVGPAYRDFLPAELGAACIKPRGSALDGALSLAREA
ncbi:BadF/BadG/BcrA/BcrD ATPase family protein [Aestuariicoccus sp. MJ-SS9]|uniref:BadF/BadG/BcrA/BcrD ATPase family protein n=1 Tax=Aestuariicoccus sp. MJ-SS9 TaxID=3079855 RepID=UPI00290C8C70|nr:BadF/BadG/BcrA/BcrD ATPase family protein [Aestuariicoccus sp. MJ-SS9]MDU8912363.1 BadF/BadG/BcrA/BcrD ATPase family protein [Aestuariicoccus sp. MJ-SS9]